MPAIVVRPRALDDLAEIWAYIADDSVAQADAFTALRPQVQNAGSSPQHRPRPAGVSNRSPDLAVRNHVIFYLPLANGVEIVRVLHGARDLEAVLDDEER